jgi:hypothetical protein
VIEILLGLALVIGVGPLTMFGVRFAKRRRGAALAAASLFLIFGMGIAVDPPPPPRIEAVARVEEEAPDDEPE